MRLFGKDLDTEVAVIAEIGVNHEGNLDTAIRLLTLAHESGADAVKFQTFTPARYASASDPARLARVTTFDLGLEGFRRLANEALRLGVAMFSTAVSDDVVPFLAENFEAIKIASGDVDFEPGIRSAARTGRPLILSTGLADDAEIDAAIGWIRDEVGPKALRDRLVLTHCVSAYPTPIDEANVRAVAYLAQRTGLRVGYSNHVIGFEASLAAVALGACMIEVHFTDRKEGREFRDHAISFDPTDLKMLVAAVKRTRASLGAHSKTRQPSEIANLRLIRKGVVAARDVAAGTILAPEDLMFARPATEFLASEIKTVIGQRLRAGVRRGELIARANVEKV